MATLPKVTPALPSTHHSLHPSPETGQEHSPGLSLRLLGSIGITCILPATGTEVWGGCALTRVHTSGLRWSGETLEPMSVRVWEYLEENAAWGPLDGAGPRAGRSSVLFLFSLYLPDLSVSDTGFPLCSHNHPLNTSPF